MWNLTVYIVKNGVYKLDFGCATLLKKAYRLTRVMHTICLEKLWVKDMIWSFIAVSKLPLLPGHSLQFQNLIKVLINWTEKSDVESSTEESNFALSSELMEKVFLNLLPIWCWIIRFSCCFYTFERPLSGYAKPSSKQVQAHARRALLSLKPFPYSSL